LRAAHVRAGLASLVGGGPTRSPGSGCCRQSLGADTPQALGQLLSDSGIENAEVTAEAGKQSLESPDDWWTVVLGSGYRWTVEQMNDQEAARVRTANLKTVKDNGIKFIETNVVYAVAKNG
jgi:hypothetical protein